jgi:hypothetical protein
VKRRDFLKSMAAAIVVGPEILKALPEAAANPVEAAAANPVIGISHEPTLTWRTIVEANRTLSNAGPGRYDLQARIMEALTQEWATYIDRRAWETMGSV